MTRPGCPRTSGSAPSPGSRSTRSARARRVAPRRGLVVAEALVGSGTTSEEHDPRTWPRTGLGRGARAVSARPESPESSDAPSSRTLGRSATSSSGCWPSARAGRSPSTASSRCWTITPSALPRTIGQRRAPRRGRRGRGQREAHGPNPDGHTGRSPSSPTRLEVRLFRGPQLPLRDRPIERTPTGCEHAGTHEQAQSSSSRPSPAWRSKASSSST